MLRSRAALAVPALAAVVLGGVTAGCSTVKNDLGVKSAATMTSAPSVYEAQLSQTCLASKATYDTDSRRLSNDVNAQTQAVDIERIIQDYRDLLRQLGAIPAPTTGTASLAVDTAKKTVPDLDKLQDKANKLRSNELTLAPKDITDITTVLKSDFCATYVQDVTKSLPSS